MGYVTESSKSYSVSVGDYNIVPEEEYDADGRLAKKMEDNRSYEYEYDSNGNIAKEIQTYNIGSDSESTEIYYYTYEERLCKPVKEMERPLYRDQEVIHRMMKRDAEGNYLSSRWCLYNNKGEYVGNLAWDAGEEDDYYEYDENGRMILAMRDGLIGDIIYDNSGVRVKEEYRKEKGGEIVMYADCECDGDGNVVRLTKHAVNESYQEEEGAVEEYQYAGGKLFACAYYKGDGTLERTKVYKYTLDGKIENITIYLGDNSVENILTPVYTKIAVYTE